MSGAKAGMIAAAVWAAAEPALGRLLRTPYSDVRLLGGAVTTARWWPTAGVALHVVNGAIFGTAFARRGGRGVKQGVLAAEIENAALWPGMLFVDRFHPERRSGAWPRLLTSPHVISYEAVAHALFGATLGALVRQR